MNSWNCNPISALTLSELPLILLSHKFMDRFSNTQLLSAGFLMSALQYAAYSLVPVPAVQVVAAILLKATSGMVFIMLNLKVVASIRKAKWSARLWPRTAP